MSDPISSTRNEAVRSAARLHRARYRRETGRTLIEGPSVVAEAIHAGADLEEIFVLDGDLPPEGWPGDITTVTMPVLERLAGTSTPRGPIAVMAVPSVSLDPSHRALVAWGVGDPGNVGTMIRTAAAFGYAFVAGPHTADPWSPKVLRSGAGGHFHTPVGMVEDLAGLGGMTLVATVPRDGELPGPVGGGEAVLIGSEAHGLPPEVVAACDRLVTIPMSDETESLNAAVAAGIVAYLGTGWGRR